MKNYVSIIQKYRFENKLTALQFSQLIGVAPMTVHRWENSKSQPNEEARMQIDNLIERDREQKHVDIIQLLENVEKNMQKVVEDISDLKAWLSS